MGANNTKDEEPDVEKITQEIEEITQKLYYKDSNKKKHPDLYLQRAKLYYEIDNIENCLKDAKAANKIDPTADGMLLIGNIHYDKKRYKQAKKSYKKALLLDGENKSAQYGLIITGEKLLESASGKDSLSFK